MNKLQKKALFNISIAGSCLLFQLVRLITGDPPIRLIISTITLILSCFLAVSYFHRWKLAKQGSSQYDERDKAIHKSAALAGLFAAFMAFFFTTLITFIGVGPGGELRIGSLLGIFLISAMSFFTTESAAILVQYGKEPKGE